MWCGRSNCLNRADYAGKMQKQRDAKSGDEDSSQQNGGKFSEDFKISLATMIPSADFESLEIQFMTSN